MSFAFGILANNIKVSLQCMNKSLKKYKTAFSHLSFLTCYGKQTCFLFWPNLCRKDMISMCIHFHDIILILMNYSRVSNKECFENPL